MTKRFCDLCEAPAYEDITRKEYLENIGKPYNAYKTAGGEGMWQQRIEVRMNVGFVDHPTGFGGPPDLCVNCMVKLLKKLTEKVEKLNKK